MEFTTKDFRTWAGSLNILWAFKSIGEAINDTECKRKIVEALDQVSLKLGNTRTVCRKYYVHPGLLSLYEENNLQKYLAGLDEIEHPDDAHMFLDTKTQLRQSLAEFKEPVKLSLISNFIPIRMIPVLLSPPYIQTGGLYMSIR